MIDQAVHARRPLGPAQTPVRDAERSVRKRVVALARGSGLPRGAIAQAVGVAGRTIGAWARSWRVRRLGRAPRGRPPSKLGPAVESEVREVLATHGRAVGLPALKGLFPCVPRSALRDLRDLVIRGTVAPCDELVWTTPGVVWSTDFTQPPVPIDGVFHHVLLVRDLASSCTLLALPCPGESAQTVAGSFTQLFARHGAPLVLKRDNGSPFIAAVVAELCSRTRLAHLRSPAYTPRYNGSIESTGGCLKARAAHIAACSGRPGCWSSDDIEAARQCANALNRPWGVHGSTPDQRWESRPSIAQADRDRFLHAVERNRQAIVRAWQQPPNPPDPSPAPGQSPGPELPAEQRSSVDRAAIRRTLVESGYLTIRRPADMSTHSPSQNGRN